MGLTKMQKGALLFGVLLMWSDQGSDICLGVDYYTNCHSDWALISFIFTCLPTMILLIFGILTLFAHVQNEHFLMNFLPQRRVIAQ